MRSLLAICLLLGAFPAQARVDLVGPNGTTFRIEDTGRGELTGPANFGAWPELCVRVCADCDAACGSTSAGGSARDGRGALTPRERAAVSQESPMSVRRAREAMPKS